MATPRWGKVDPAAASTAIGVAVPLAVVLTAVVLFLGWLYAPGTRGEVIHGRANPIWRTRPVHATSERFRTQPAASENPT